MRNHTEKLGRLLWKIGCLHIIFGHKRVTDVQLSLINLLGNFLAFGHKLVLQGMLGCHRTQNKTFDQKHTEKNLENTISTTTPVFFGGFSSFGILYFISYKPKKRYQNSKVKQDLQIPQTVRVVPALLEKKQKFGTLSTIVLLNEIFGDNKCTIASGLNNSPQPFIDGRLTQLGFWEFRWLRYLLRHRSCRSRGCKSCRRLIHLGLGQWWSWRGKLTLLAGSGHKAILLVPPLLQESFKRING